MIISVCVCLGGRGEGTLLGSNYVVKQFKEAVIKRITWTHMHT